MSRSNAEAFLYDLLLSRVSTERDWFVQSYENLKKSTAERDLHIFMGLAPRKLGKADLAPSAEELAAANAVYDGWKIDGWSIDGAARVLGLLAFPRTRPFADLFKDLRRTSDAAEMIALYRGLPVYPEPDSLAFEVGEGLRSNLRPVFEAIAHHNPYPRDQFDDHRWNHMILKALFVDTELTPIMGLESRANAELARILVDYAAERNAAGRPISPELWIPVAPFKDDPEIRSRLDRLGDAVPSL